VRIVLTYGRISLNPNSAIVTYDGKEISLLLQEYRLLLLFLNHPHHVLSYDFIIDNLWLDLDRIPTHSTVRTHIKRIRQAFKQANVTEEIIETVHGVGYRLKRLSPPENELNIPDQLSSAIAQKFLKAKAVEYIIIDENLTVQAISPWGKDYSDYPDRLAIGQPVAEAFPELIGLETVIQQLFNGQLETFELSAVARSVNNRRPQYINFYLITDDSQHQQILQNNSLLFIFLENNSREMIYRQRLVQTINESFLTSENC